MVKDLEDTDANPHWHRRLTGCLCQPQSHRVVRIQWVGKESYVAIPCRKRQCKNLIYFEQYHPFILCTPTPPLPSKNLSIAPHLERGKISIMFFCTPKTAFDRKGRLTVTNSQILSTSPSPASAAIFKKSMQYPESSIYKLPTLQWISLGLCQLYC